MKVSSDDDDDADDGGDGDGDGDGDDDIIIAVVTRSSKISYQSNNLKFAFPIQIVF